MAIHLLNKSKDQFPNLTHQNLISTCAQDIDRLRGLLDDLMTVSRFDATAQRFELQKVDLGKLLSHAVQSFHAMAREKGVQLTRSISTSSRDLGSNKKLLVTMDATKIAWALSNLLTNALRHTPRGGKVEVFLRQMNDWAEVRVKDTGPGIDPQRQGRIFEKFNPYYDLRIARCGAVGTGLAIAKEIVKAHGGEIWVASQPGLGAEFGFTLPMSPKEDRMRFKNNHFSDRSNQSTPEVENRL
jgi:signal transduction histidine kinase